MSDGWFDERVAARYDESTGTEFEPAVIAQTVDVLAELAGDGPVLELAIGTGRIAKPLAERGIAVHGIDMSRAMVARIRTEAIGVTIGDIASTRVEGTFSLVYLVFNTINNLTSQEAQVGCFRNAAAHLAPGGCFVIEVGVPKLQRLPPGQTVVPFDVSAEHIGFDEYELLGQGMTSHHLSLVEGSWERLSVPFRYVWASELDLMAQLAGLSLRDRWGDWDRSPFTAESRKHVSVWELPSTP